VNRICKEEGLNFRSKCPRRNRRGAHRETYPEVTGLHQCWSLDIEADQLFDGRKFRALTVVDCFSRKCLKIDVGQSIKGSNVVEAVNQIIASEGELPQRIKVDNGSEFISNALDLWANENKVPIDFARPGKPTDYPFNESFNGSFRDECLIQIGSYLWKTLRRKSKNGVRNATIIDHIVHRGIFPRQSS
jgi:putative transposase